MDAITIGEILIDFIPGTEEASYIRNPGGGPANAAVAMAKNGLDVGMYTRMGDDDFGRFLLATMEGYGVKILTPELLPDAVTTMAFSSVSRSCWVLAAPARYSTSEGTMPFFSRA